MELVELELTPLYKSGPTETKVAPTIDLIFEQTSEPRKWKNSM